MKIVCFFKLAITNRITNYLADTLDAPEYLDGLPFYKLLKNRKAFL